MSRYKVWVSMEGLRMTAVVMANNTDDAVKQFEHYLWAHGFKDDDGVHVEEAP